MLLAPLLLLTTPGAVAHAAETLSMRYLLAVDGAVVGHRDLQLRYLSGPDGEIRLLQSWTQLDVLIAGQPFAYRQRLSGMGNSGGFTSVIREGDQAREVQAVRGPLGWSVSVTDGGQARVWELGADRFDMTSLSLVDPDASGALAGRTHLRVLVAETGEVLEGGLRQAGTVQVALGGVQLPATEYVWALPEGEVRLAYGAQGHLLRYTMRVAGRVVTATLDRPPPARTYGAVEGPLITTGVDETEL